MSDDHANLDEKLAHRLATLMSAFYEEHPEYGTWEALNTNLNLILTYVSEQAPDPLSDKISLLEAFICKIEDCKRRIIQQGFIDQGTAITYINDQDVPKTIN